MCYVVNREISFAMIVIILSMLSCDALVVLQMNKYITTITMRLSCDNDIFNRFTAAISHATCPISFAPFSHNSFQKRSNRTESLFPLKYPTWFHFKVFFCVFETFLYSQVQNRHQNAFTNLDFLFRNFIICFHLSFIQKNKNNTTV